MARETEAQYNDKFSVEAHSKRCWREPHMCILTFIYSVQESGWSGSVLWYSSLVNPEKHQESVCS